MSRLRAMRRAMLRDQGLPTGQPIRLDVAPEPIILDHSRPKRVAEPTLWTRIWEAVKGLLR